MKKILLSIATIALVGALGFAATNAFFTDTETSTGNTFQAGTMGLQVKSQCSYNDVAGNQCGVWDYGQSVDKFFNFIDLKPGDRGENTISFKVANNAWMCANLEVTANSNLGKYLNIFWWVDTNGDNIYQTTEKVLYGGPRTLDDWLFLANVGAGQIGALPLTFADSYLNWITWTGSNPGNTLPVPAYNAQVPATEQHLGVGWCFGTLTLNTITDGFTCNGAGDQQDAQGTQILANLTFTVEQHRNNPQFLCPEHEQLRSVLFPR